ncbi:sensor histidine kinase [Nostoc sp. FACHB-152]|uniref:sensor histidine kinase n=1 Tax=unclassified Nostoc TaxID=2593658 RepID=UPI00168467B5|nr:MULTISPECIES: cache domain-containing protein [unclassified Nostoc]MBD2449192.1 sensor histidine kinase [Nostoc sp. FACHB-152]MBD2466341.1 sensor histidine kinase [Nostoc sp. FACHB-145]
MPYPLLRDLFQVRQYKSVLKKQLPNLKTPLILIGSTLVIGIVGITSYLVVKELIVQQLQEKALLQVRQGTDEIDQWLAICSTEIQTIANTEVARSLNWAVIQPYLKAEIKHTDRFFKIAVSLPNGSYYNSEVGKTDTNNKDRDFIQKALAGQVNISDPFISRTTGIPSVAIAAPIRQSYDIKSRPIAVLNGSLKVDRITQVVNKLQYGNGSYAFALNSKGEPIIHPNSALMSTQEKPAPSFLQSTDSNLATLASRMVNKEQGIELIPIDGTKKYVAYFHLKQANWSIALVIPRENIESQLHALNLLASILGGLLGIATIIAWRQIQLSQRAKMQVVLLSQQRKTLQQQAQELEQTLKELQQTQAQLIQSEKMSSLSQLVAGVAHEINNPVSFIYSNITPANEYLQDLLRLLQLYQHHYPQPVPEIQDEVEAIELNFLIEDLPKLLTSMAVGADRIKQIVLSLRNFSRLDEAEIKKVNIHEGIDSTLMFLENRLQATPDYPAIEAIKEYADLPLVECYPGELNQVFINLLTNAIDAIQESFVNRPTHQHQDEEIASTSLIRKKGQIRIQTELNADKQIVIRIADNGIGIPKNLQKQVFNPFFTTKPVGKSTGLALSISYQIVTEKHQGKLQFTSTFGKGTEFVMAIPLKQVIGDK